LYMSRLSVVTCVHTSWVSNYYKKTSRRMQKGGGRGATTECLPCKPEDPFKHGVQLSRGSERHVPIIEDFLNTLRVIDEGIDDLDVSRVYTRHGFRITIRRRVEECNAVAAVARRQNVCLASQRISVQARGPSLLVALFTRNTV
ncbi:hypothetical protein TSAR_000884, partial [Trichomalopsis sarcophagae]